MNNRLADQGSNSKTTFQLTQVYVTTAAISWVIFGGIGYVSSAYKRTSTIPQFLSFESADTPPVPGTVFSGPLGVHSFGDFLQPFWQAQLHPSPYIAGHSSYMPAANGFFWVLGYSPFWLALAVTQVASLGLTMWSMSMALPSQASKARRVLVIAWSVMLTAPVISGLDRGNIQILTVSLMMLGCALLAKGKPLTAAVIIGLAGSLKLYPILLVGLFFRRGMLRYAIVSCASALLVSALTLAMFQGGLVQNIMEMKGNLASSQAELARLYLAFNSSIMGLVHSVNSLKEFGNPFVDFSAILTIVAMVLLALTIFFSRNSKSYCYITSAVTSFMILILEYSPAYALGVLLCATFWIFAEAPMSHGDHIIRAALAGTISLILVPKQIPTPLGTVFDSSGATLSSLLNPILLLVIMGTSLIGAITSRRPS